MAPFPMEIPSVSSARVRQLALAFFFSAFPGHARPPMPNHQLTEKGHTKETTVQFPSRMQTNRFGMTSKVVGARRLQILNHEMGHKLGMVPDGTGRRLEKPANFYTGQGHQGPHCANNAVYTSGTANPWQGTPHA